MRSLIITWTILTLSSCSYESIHISEVDELLSVQLTNNQGQLLKIKDDLKGFKIDQIKKNIELIDELTALHNELLKLNDTIDLINNDQAANKARTYIHKHFNSISYYQHAKLEITEKTPKTLLKLHLATMEGFFLKEQENRYSYEDYTIALDKLQPLVVPDKIVFRANEPITGRILLISTTEDPKRLAHNAEVIKKIEINGIEIKNEEGLGKFEIKNRKNRKPGELLLTTIVTLPDTVIKAETTVYVQE